MALNADASLFCMPFLLRFTVHTYIQQYEYVVS